VTYYFDASVQKPVALALSHVRDDILWAGGPGAPQKNVLDIDWLPIAGDEQWKVIVRDKRIRSRPAEIQAVQDFSVGMFCLTTAGQSTKWEVLQLLVARWGAMEVAALRTTPPYIFAVTRNGVRRIL